MTATAEPATGPNRAPSPVAGPGSVSPRPANRQGAGLPRRLAEALAGEAKFDAFTRGRYSNDASIYQIMPAGVVLPRSAADIAATLKIAAEHDVPVIMRGGGTSQNGQPIGRGLVVDCSRHFNGIIAYDAQAGTITVEPGMVLERLNTRVKADGWFFPVEPSTATRCTIGGMAGNNSCGARSLRFGKMSDNVLRLEALFHDGEPFGFGLTGNEATGVTGSRRAGELAAAMRALAESERDEILRMYPRVQRRVGGYNLDALIEARPNLAHLLVGSEGTLAATTSVTLKLSRLPTHRVMGVCHFPSFRSAMETTKAIVDLDPVAVELVDNNVLVLGADIPMFRATLADITRGTPNCLLLVEFAGDDRDALMRDLKRLDTCMADNGHVDAVVEVPEPIRQKSVWEVREACLNIMMSMTGDAKPVSFIEDCAVPLEHLADYTDAVTEVFTRHGTRGTWYAHASVGCLHVRPILDMKQGGDVAKMRAIAEAASEQVRRFKGSYSGEHGDGISRSEYIAPMFGERLTRAFEQVKDRFDPENRLNPGKIVRPLKMDDRSLMRFQPGYSVSQPAKTALDWSELGWLRRRRRDVQQQRHLPEARGRGDVPVLPGHERRAAPHPWPGELPAAGDFGPARQGRLHQPRDEADPGSLCLVQGLPPRMPHRHRHGEDEGRVPAPLPCPPRPTPEGAAGGGPAALCRHRRLAGAAPQPARSPSRPGETVGTGGRALGAAHPAALAQALGRAGRAGASRRRDRGFPRHRAVRRHVPTAPSSERTWKRQSVC